MDRAIDSAPPAAMIGWLAFAALAALILAGTMFAVRYDRGAAMLVASALFVAAAGYAWQGSPWLRGAPAAAAHDGNRPDTLFASERVRLLDRFGETGQWLLFADALNRMGEDQAAASALRGAIAKRPGDAALRVGYAHALLVLADYHLTPAVALAYDRAKEAARPNDPAPRYFTALAELEAGDVVSAERDWRGLRAALPPGSPWVRVLDERLRLFDMMRAR